MKKNDNEKVIGYIDGAKVWLDKAKSEYNQENAVGGELILNLAQAEIKYARELSHTNFVSDSKESIPVHNFKLILPVAASIMLMLGAGLWLQMGGLNTFKKAPVIVRENPSPVLKQPTALTSQNQNAVTVEPPLTAAVNALNKQEPVNTGNELKSEPKSKIDTNQPVRNLNQIGKTVLSNQTRGTENSTVQPNLQPVSKLAIDEEALAKEASHSLRNGK